MLILRARTFSKHYLITRSLTSASIELSKTAGKTPLNTSVYHRASYQRKRRRMRLSDRKTLSMNWKILLSYHLIMRSTESTQKSEWKWLKNCENVMFKFWFLLYCHWTFEMFTTSSRLFLGLLARDKESITEKFNRLTTSHRRWTMFMSNVRSFSRP